MSHPPQPPQNPGQPPPPPGFRPSAQYWQQPAPESPMRLDHGGTPYVIPPAKINHALHLALTLLTCGLWGIVWICVAIGSQKKSKLVYPDGHVEYR